MTTHATVPGAPRESRKGHRLEKWSLRPSKADLTGGFL
jgi:hypothetical protein